jgi:S1-C subfamily serine protease
VFQIEALLASGTSQGSAVAVTSSELLTNCHVVQGARKVILKQAKKEWVARLVRADPRSDRCVLAVADGILTPVRGVRAHGDLQIGEPLFTIGSPAGLELSLANGILSGLREEGGKKFVQTTAPISPGSSGGGLFDARGNLVGVTTLIVAGRERLNQSLNFALPADSFWQP